MPDPRAAAEDRPGTLVLVVGPSGVGKDSLIAYARARLADSGAVVFPRRVITRADGGAAEDHESLSEQAFDRAVAENAFALHWRAHGLGYGIPAAITEHLAAGRSVVINVSRAKIAEARCRFAPLLVVSVVAPPSVLAARLAQRGRETPDSIQRRLERGGRLPVAGPDVLTIDNAGPIEQAGETLVAALTALRTGPPFSGKEKGQDSPEG